LPGFDVLQGFDHAGCLRHRQFAGVLGVVVLLEPVAELRQTVLAVQVGPHGEHHFALRIRAFALSLRAGHLIEAVVCKRFHRLDGDLRRAGVRDGLDLGFIQHAQAANTQRYPALGFRLSLHDGVGKRVAAQACDAYSADAGVLASICRNRISCHGVDILHALALQLDDVDLALISQLIGGVLLGVKRQLAIEGDVVKRLGEWVEAD